MTNRKGLLGMMLLALGCASLAQAQSRPSTTDGGLRQDYEIEVRGYLPAQNVSSVQPAYYETLRRSRVEGTVVLEGRIDEGGKVRDLEVESGHPVLARAARHAVLKWRYRPARLRGSAVPSHLNVVVHFRSSGTPADSGRAVAMVASSSPIGTLYRP